MNGSCLERRSIAMAFPRVFSLPHSVVGLTYVAGYVLLDWISFIHPFAPFGITPWNPCMGLFLSRSFSRAGPSFFLRQFLCLI
jgi:hypothetical protein